MTSPQPEIPPPSLNDVLFERRGSTGLITLNRPVVLNAVNWSICRRLWAALDAVEADDAVKVVVLTGAGRAFCSGGDIQSTQPDDGLPSPTGTQITMRLWSMARPVIAAVHGYAVGQGHELAGVCDFTIAAEDSVFGELQIRHGFAPPTLITPFLTGPKAAKEILMLGERIPAAEALRLGLVNRVVPAGQHVEVALDMAKKLAALPERAVRMNKQLVNRAMEFAGYLQTLDYRADSAFMGRFGQEAEAGDPHLAVLREQGWEAFRRSRDAAYNEQEAAGPGVS